MITLGIGIDIVNIDRIKKVPNFERFSEYILTKNEIQEMEKSRDKFQFISSRFAAKEAVIKAYPEKINYQDIESYKNGEKFMERIKGENGKYHILSSISHSSDNAVAIAIISKN